MAHTTAVEQLICINRGRCADLIRFRGLNCKSCRRRSRAMGGASGKQSSRFLSKQSHETQRTWFLTARYPFERKTSLSKEWANLLLLDHRETLHHSCRKWASDSGDVFRGWPPRQRHYPLQLVHCRRPCGRISQAGNQRTTSFRLTCRASHIMKITRANGTLLTYCHVQQA